MTKMMMVVIILIIICIIDNKSVGIINAGLLPSSPVSESSLASSVPNTGALAAGF